MSCLDCGAPAVATCTHCGAAACHDHLVATTEHLTITVPLNRQVTVEPAARRIRCHICQKAYDATNDPRGATQARSG
ncbi:hypothetical protein GCM10009765_80810 [Fodinicola feengrottensis]|uniref:DUF2180 family protein n=1 Tax=Fodinicola feengrottensis TaxID=435914 RepID=A0ABN2J916_9ACTN